MQEQKQQRIRSLIKLRLEQTSKTARDRRSNATATRIARGVEVEVVDAGNRRTVRVWSMPSLRVDSVQDELAG